MSETIDFTIVSENSNWIMLLRKIKIRTKKGKEYIVDGERWYTATKDELNCGNVECFTYDSPIICNNGHVTKMPPEFWKYLFRRIDSILPVMDSRTPEYMYVTVISAFYRNDSVKNYYKAS